MSVGQSFDLGDDLRIGNEQNDLDVLRTCLVRIDDDDIFGTPWALEFGTGNGTSTRVIAEYVPVISFDAFKGLPEDWRPEYKAGHFSDITEPRDIPGATIVVGWFDDVLPTYEFPDAVSLIHFDADLYTSTRTALMAVRHLIQPGVFLVFDEFFGFDDDFAGEPGEAKAWREFAEDEPGLAWKVVGHGREQWGIEITEGVLV